MSFLEKNIAFTLNMQVFRTAVYAWVEPAKPGPAGVSDKQLYVMALAKHPRWTNSTLWESEMALENLCLFMV